MKGYVLSVTCPVKPALVLGEISVQLALQIGDQQLENVGRNALKTFFHGEIVVDDVIIIARTAMVLAPKGAHLVRHIFPQKVVYALSALVLNIMSPERGPAVHVMTRVGLAPDLDLLVVLLALIL